MNTQNILDTIETQHENYDLELNDQRIISDADAIQYKYEPVSIRITRRDKELAGVKETKIHNSYIKKNLTKKQINRANDRKETAYNNNYSIQHDAAIQLIKNRFNN